MNLLLPTPREWVNIGISVALGALVTLWIQSPGTQPTHAHSLGIEVPLGRVPVAGARTTNAMPVR